MTSTVSISSRWDFWFAVVKSVIICRLRFQSCVISVTSTFGKRWVILVSIVSCDSKTPPRDLPRPREFIWTRRWRQGRAFIPLLASSIQIFLRKRKITGMCWPNVFVPKVRYSIFKKSAVEIRSFCLADSSSYRGKLRKACSGCQVWFAGRFVKPTSWY